MELVAHQDLHNRVLARNLNARLSMVFEWHWGRYTYPFVKNVVNFLLFLLH